ncbi:MAG TPA: FkbM family methyltransferase [Caulobacteraceae bacterium]
MIDVGAHGGQFAKLFARMAPAGEVYAFEPSVYARSVLIPAIGFNRLRNVKIVPLGLSDQPGERVLHTPIKGRSRLGYGIAHLGDKAEGERAEDQTVTVTTLDEFARRRGLRRLDFIKADIEGWELRALVGGETTLKRFQPPLFLEVDGRFLSRAGDTPGDLFDWLANLGYSGFTSLELAPAPAYVGPGDYLFVAANKPLISSRQCPIARG